LKYLVVNAAQLLTMSGPERARAGSEMSKLGMVQGGAVLVEDGVVLAAGLKDIVQMNEKARGARILDAEGGVVAPGFVDSHSHPVFTEPRLKDFEGRIAGKKYADLAAEGGGILWTVNGVRGATQDQLAAGLRRRVHDFIASGTTTLEAKSGYGLDLENELKMLRAIKQVGEEGPLELVATFIGAHAVPPEFKGRADDYVKRVCEEILPKVAEEKLAAFVDVFCEDGFFTRAQSEKVLAAGIKAGLKTKIHAEQLSRSGGVELAAAAKCASADHLDCVEQKDIDALVKSGVIACLVPGSNYFLNKPYPPARRLIDGGAALALATDFNPGTCPCWDMRQILSIACTQMKMTPAEAMTAATVNGAHALGLGKRLGSLEGGKQADLVCHEATDYREIPYFFGAPKVRWVMKKGVLVHGQGGRF
jgi:imidazolonepropionase